ncbi:MAG: thioredoxin-dependent thiol peroxidase [Dysgonomonas sp.]
MGLNIGDKIPEVLGTDQDGKEIKASDYSGHKLVLYFYPKDSTPGCTAEACSFRDNFSEFRKAGYQILGVSIDDQKSHKKFIEKQQLPFPLIADTDKELVETFGVWGEKSFMGRNFMGTIRTTFLISESGIIEKVIGPKEIKTKELATQILNQL